MASGRSAASLALLLGLLGASAARAGATVDLLFVGVNGVPIAPTPLIAYYPPGYQATMAVRLRNDVPLTLAVFSLNYDFGGELDVISAFQWRGVPINKAATDFFNPVAPLDPTTDTFVGSFQGTTTNFGGPRVLPPAAGAFAGGYQMGTVVWHVNTLTDSHIISGLLSIVDGVFDATFDNMANQFLFRSATVRLGEVPPPIPEPAAGALLGLGVVALALLGRRGRQRP